jgi:hypothetical protein
MTKREMAQILADQSDWSGEAEGARDRAVDWYMANMTTAQLREQAEVVQGKRTVEQLTHKYDH